MLGRADSLCLSGAGQHDGIGPAVNQEPSGYHTDVAGETGAHCRVSQTVVWLLVCGLIQQQVRLYLHDQQQHVPGNKGPTAAPTAAVLLSLFTPATIVHVQVDQAVFRQVYGW